MDGALSSWKRALTLKIIFGVGVKHSGLPQTLSLTCQEHNENNSSGCSHISVDQCLSFFFAPLNCQMCIHLCNEGFIHCNPSNIPLYVIVRAVLADSLITSCKHILSHLRNRSSAFILLHITLTQASCLSHMFYVHCSTLITDVFLIVVMQTEFLNETLLSWIFFVTPAICAPSLSPLVFFLMLS